MPLRSGIADLVAINATVHHCDDMRAVIAESARLVAPGGLLVTDHVHNSPPGIFADWPAGLGKRGSPFIFG